MDLLNNRVAVVTGGGRGIGASIARFFAQQGAHVAVVSRNLSSCQKVADALNSEGFQANAYAVDVADSQAVATFGKQVTSDFGKVDILVNNAGITRDTLLLRMSEEDWDLVIDTNLKGAFLMAKSLQRPLMKSPCGRIINISSVIGLVGNPGQANYASSKAGLLGLTKSLARELASRKVTCNAIAPGFISTDMTQSLSEKQMEGILSQIPLKTIGKPEDIAQLALFLASDAAAYITGQTLACDGGMTM